MRRTILTLLSSLLLAAPLLVTTGSPAAAMPDGTSRQSVTIRPEYVANDIYTPTLPRDYRTSPSVFKDPVSGLLDQYNCGPDVPGSNTQVIRFTTSSDGDRWTPETIALRPTAGSPDARGVCDPNVVKAGLYFYLAYTGFSGTKHAVFVARTSSLAQPWQKWNGQGWGGPRPPAPIVTAATSAPGYGVGQPSLVVQQGSLAIFYDFHSGATWQTRLATAPMRPDNVATWPAEITGGSTVLVHPGNDSLNVCGGSYDSTDVVYSDLRSRYVALTTDAKTSADSSLQAYESSTGQSFTTALTLARSVGLGPVSPIKDHAHHISFVRDATGRLTEGTGSVVYGYGDTDCPSRLRRQQVETGVASTGWINEPLTKTAGTAHWDLATDGWTFDNNGWLYAENKFLDPAPQAFLRTSLASGSATIDLDYKQDTWPSGLWTGISFAQPFPLIGQSGYFLRMHTTGEVTLARGEEDNVVATGATSASAQFFANHLQVVLSDNTITVYNGVGHDSLTNAILRYTSPDDLQLAGYIGLQSRGNSSFANLTVRDNVPASYRSQDENVLDWKQSTGDWKVRAPSTISSYTQGSSQTYLQGTAGPVSNYNAHLGDGTYAATVQLNPGAVPTAWGGLNIANAAEKPNLDWASGGYLVFIRYNGSLGLYRAGTGQVVPDIPTGLNPITTPVRIRVLKTGPNIQVYLNGNALPAINYTDPGTPYTTGGFGLATEQDGGVFTNVSYAAGGA